MKFSNLLYQGFLGKNGSVDFNAKALGLVIVTEADAGFLKDVLTFTLYGTEEDVESRAYCVLKFNHENIDYTLTREVDPVDDGNLHSVDVVDNTTGKLVASGIEETREFVLKTLNLSKHLFRELFYIDKDDIASAFSQDSIKREGYIEARLQRLDGADDVDLRYKALLNEQAKYLKVLEDIDQITKVTLNDNLKQRDAYQTELGNIRAELNETYSDIARSKKYDVDSAKYYEENIKLEKLNHSNIELEERANRAKASKKVSELADVFVKSKALEKEIAECTATLTEKEKKLKELNEKYEASKKSEKTYQGIFINDDTKKTVHKEKLCQLITEISKNPKQYKVYDKINSHYVENDKELNILKERNAQLEGEMTAIKEALSLLETQKSQLWLNAAYKKDVSDAAVYESSLTVLLDDIKNSEERLDGLNQERNRLFDESKRLASVIAELTKEKSDLYHKIKGNHAGIKDAINADVLYKQTIYSRHLIVSANEVELNAVEEKMASVRAANEKYRSKLDDAEQNKKKVEEHLAVIMDRLTLLTAKKNEYESFNKMRDISDGIILGSHCPVCDGFVTVKKELPEKNTKDLDAQIQAVNQEIARCNKAIYEVNTSIGQYQAAYRTSTQYGDSLAVTLSQKKKIINDILTEYNANSIPELFQMVSDAANNSKALTLNYDKYNEVDAELRKESEAALLINDRLNKLDAEILPKENQRLVGLLGIFEQKTNAYDALQPALNGENGEQLLLKIQVAEKEYQTIEDEIIEKLTKLNDLREQHEENAKVISVLTSRGIPVKDGKEEFTYEEIVVKTIMTDLNNLVLEIEKADAKKEVAKLRLSAILKVQSKVKEEMDALRLEVDVLSTNLAAKTQMLDDIRSRYGERFNEVGLNDVELIDKLIISDELIAEYESDYANNQEAILRITQNIDELTIELEEGQPYKDVYQEMLNRLDELKEKESRTILLLDEIQKIYEDNLEKYNIICATRLRLTFIDARIKGIEDLSQALLNATIDRKCFADYTINLANLKVKNWSHGNYYIEVRKDGIVLINALKGKVVTQSAFSQSERALVDYAIALSCNEALHKLMATDLMSIIPIPDDSANKINLSTLAEAAKEKDIVVTVKDEGAIYKIVSKL